MRPFLSLMLTTVLATAVPHAVTAQSRSTAPGEVIKSCDKAVKTIENERPAHKQTSALEYLARCGQRGAAATAQVVSSSRTESDTLALQPFSRIVDGWRDAEIMNAALGLARDPGATIPARVYAIEHLLVLVHPIYTYSYGRLIAGPRSTAIGDGRQLVTPGCKQGVGSEVPDRVGTPLPSDYLATIRQALAVLASDSLAPTPVRNAAACME